MKTLKTWKKRAALLLAAVMTLVFCMGMTTFAAGTPVTVTVKAPAGTNPTGMTISAYQVLEQTNENATAGQETYEVTTEFAAFFADAEKAYGMLSNPGTIYVGYENNALTVLGTAEADTIAVSLSKGALDDKYFAADLLSRLDAEQTRIMSDWLTQYIKEKSIAVSKSTDIWSGSVETGMSAAIEDLDPGFYAIVSSDVPDGIAIEQSILNTAVATGITLKAETIPITKTVENNNDSSDTEGENAKAAVGDILNYTIKTKVPDLTNYDTEHRDDYKFVISDTMENQELDVDSLQLTINGATVTLSDVAAVNPGIYDQGTQTFTITFDVKKLKDGGYSDQEVILTYSAELMAEAESINGNKVTLTYSNDPYSDSESGPSDETEVYTYGLDIQKEFSDGSADYSKVTFNLRAGSATGTVIEFEGANGVYTKADSETTSAVTDLKLDPTGSLALSGLDEGTYYLVETEAPEDFNPVTVVIKIAADINDPAKIDLTLSSVKYDDGTAITPIGSADQNRIGMSFSVLNQKGFDLPETGGAGTWMFTIGGIVLIAAAGGLFLTLRRKSR